MNQLIGIAGRAGSGKDTAASFLVAQHGFVTSAFADPLKRSASELFGIPLDDFYSRTLKERYTHKWGYSPRQIMQKLSDGVKSEFGPTIFIDRWCHDWVPAMDTTSVVVTDVRYEEEAQMVRALGGTVVQIIRPNDSMFMLDQTHGSEQFQSEWADDVVHNTGSLDDLAAAMHAVVTKRGIHVR